MEKTRSEESVNMSAQVMAISSLLRTIKEPVYFCDSSMDPFSHW